MAADHHSIMAARFDPGHWDEVRHMASGTKANGRWGLGEAAATGRG